MSRERNGEKKYGKRWCCACDSVREMGRKKLHGPLALIVIHSDSVSFSCIFCRISRLSAHSLVRVDWACSKSKKIGFSYAVCFSPSGLPLRTRIYTKTQIAYVRPIILFTIYYLLFIMDYFSFFISHFLFFIIRLLFILYHLLGSFHFIFRFLFFISLFIIYYVSFIIQSFLLCVPKSSKCGILLGFLYLFDMVFSDILFFAFSGDSAPKVFFDRHRKHRRTPKNSKKDLNRQVVSPTPLKGVFLTNTENDEKYRKTAK